ncbi:DUF6907 domain-containing protein [Streptomyces viridochromogenes]|nr:hypothetical protein [Streptomyces viridochromogenes]
MSNATVLTLQPSEHPCPAWCGQEAHAEATGSHVSVPVRLPAPEGMALGFEVPLLFVQIGLTHDEEARGESPRLWLSAADGTAELDSAALGALLDALEHFAMRLRGLRHRYDTVIRGGAPESVDHYPSAAHPLELVALCPPWCQYRDDDGHTLDGLLVDHFHATHEHTMELDLQPVARTKDEPDPETLEVVMEHMAHARWPQIDLTVGGLWGSKHVALTLEEADELRSRLNDFIARGREYAQPETVASLQELIDYCGVRILESEFDAKRFWGHAVSDTAQGGPAWVTVPRDAAGARLEDLVTSLLASLHEKDAKLIAQTGAEVRQTGRVPGVPAAPAVPTAA